MPTLLDRPAKFTDPDVTAKDEARADVAFKGLKTLWVNTGTLCNITCVHCYIESSPANDRVVYFTVADQTPFLGEAEALHSGPIEIGFTGGEPFLNPHMIDLAQAALGRGHRALILTNAMRPMMRQSVRAGLLALRDEHRARLTLRVSLDSYMAERHDEERSAGAFAATLKGIDWLVEERFEVSLADRTLWNGGEGETRAG